MKGRKWNLAQLKKPEKNTGLVLCVSIYPICAGLCAEETGNLEMPMAQITRTKGLALYLKDREKTAASIFSQNCGYVGISHMLPAKASGVFPPL